MNSTLFLRDLTCIDHATINMSGMVVGGSFNLDVLVSGDVEEHEQVVIDFSKCKKMIKDLIDDFDNGFDHKCWVGNYPILKLDNGNCKVVTPVVEIEGPSHMFRKLDPTKSYELNIQDYLQENLEKVYPSVKVKVVLRPVGFTRDFPSIMFRYAHGLKNSSSCGCRRIAHGHLSFIELEPEEGADRNLVYHLLADIQSYMRNIYFVFNENILDIDEANITVGYTCAGGDTYRIKLNQRIHDVIILNQETTVENLVESLVNRYRSLLKAARVKRVYMSEGLMKGAMVEV